MSYIFVGIAVMSVVTAVMNGNMAELSGAILSGSVSGVELCIGLAGGICLWSGLMEIATQSGLTGKITSLLSPFTRLLFKGVSLQGEALELITLNMSANMLGLGNAATPIGISAMNALKIEQHVTDIASNQMILFVVLNTASLQIFPTTTIMLRQLSGSADATAILPAVWLSSICSVAVGILCASMFGKLWGK